MRSATSIFNLSNLSGAPGTPITIAHDLIETAGGILLLAGLWTPVAGVLVAVDELWIGLSLYPSQHDGRWNHIFLAVLTASVAMVGPGAWSIDARLFGRKLQHGRSHSGEEVIALEA